MPPLRYVARIALFAMRRRRSMQTPSYVFSMRLSIHNASTAKVDVMKRTYVQDARSVSCAFVSTRTDDAHVRRVARFENVRALNVHVNAHAACPRATNVSRAGTNVSRAHQRRTGACVVYVWGETEATRVYFSVRSPSVDVGCRLTVT